MYIKNREKNGITRHFGGVSIRSTDTDQGLWEFRNTGFLVLKNLTPNKNGMYNTI